MILGGVWKTLLSPEEAQSLKTILKSENCLAGDLNHPPHPFCPLSIIAMARGKELCQDIYAAVPLVSINYRPNYSTKMSNNDSPLVK